MTCKKLEELYVLHIMMSMSDTIEFYKKMIDIVSKNVDIDTDFEEKFYRGLHRLEYENQKRIGVKPKKIPMLRKGHYIKKCGNCGSESINGNPHWKYCPNCGYLIKKRGN